MVTKHADEKFDQAVLDGRATSVPALFEDRVSKTPDTNAFGSIVGDRVEWLTWADVDVRVRRLAAGLVSLGVEPQQRVAIECSTRIEWGLIDLGVMLAGGATTTIYPTTTTADVQHILADSESRVLFVEDETQLAKYREIADKVPQVSQVVIIDGSGGEGVITLSELEQRGEDLLAQDPDVLRPRIDAVGSDDLSTLIYTSGTTGRPKGVRLPHSAWTYEAAAVDASGAVQPGDVQFLWLPLAHVFGKLLLTLPLQIGFPTVIDGRVDKIVENLPIAQPVWMGAAPRIFEKVYSKINTSMAAEGGVKAKLFGWATGEAIKASEARSEGRSISGIDKVKLGLADKLVLHKVRDRFGGNVRFFISGSARLDPGIARWFDGVGMPILEGYGLTETSAATCVNRPESNMVGTVGWPLPGTEISLAEDGEVLVRGPGVLAGYHNLPDVTAESVVDGWFHTGDIGEILPSGHVRITDRKKDLFKTSNGKYVAPGTIEASFKAICPYASQLVIEGDGRKFVSALVTLDEPSIVEWAQHKGLADTDYHTVVTSPEAREMVQGYIDELNSSLNRWEQVRQFVILPRDLTIEDGEMTPSLKLKRKVVTEKYGKELDELYVD